MDISVIMTAYNAERYISRALESAVNQSFNGQFEIIVGDDCSNDLTASIIQSYSNRYPGLINAVFNPQNIGYSRNYSNLIQMAQGKYVAILDHDDIWLTENKLQIQFDYLENNPTIGMLCANSKLIDQDDVIRDSNRDRSGDISFYELMNGHEDVFSPTIMMRNCFLKQILEQSEWYIDHHCFFDAMWALWFSHHSRVYWMPDILSAYRVLSESGCHSMEESRRMSLEKKYFMMKAYFILDNPVQLEKRIDFFSNEYDYLYRMAMSKGENNVRKTKAYRMGSKIRNCFKKRWIM